MDDILSCDSSRSSDPQNILSSLFNTWAGEVVIRRPHIDSVKRLSKMLFCDSTHNNEQTEGVATTTRNYVQSASEATTRVRRQKIFL